MKPEDARKLLGGWAAGNLTPDERKALLHAAMQDQSLFDALADSEALRALLAEQGIRDDLIETLEPQFHPAAPLPAPWWRRPWGWVLAGSLVAASFAFVILIRRAERPAQTQIVAQVQPPPAPVQSFPPPPPAAAAAPENVPLAKSSPPAGEASQPKPAAPADAAPPRKSERPVETAPVASFEVSDARRPPPSAQSGVAGGTPGGVLGGMFPAAPAAMQLRDEAAPARALLAARALPPCKVVLERRSGDVWTVWDTAQPVSKDDEIAVRALCGATPTAVVEVLQGDVERSFASPPAAARDRIPLGLLTPGEKRVRVKFPAPQPAVELRLSVR